MEMLWPVRVFPGALPSHALNKEGHTLFPSTTTGASGDAASHTPWERGVHPLRRLPDATPHSAEGHQMYLPVPPPEAAG